MKRTITVLGAAAAISLTGGCTAATTEPDPTSAVTAEATEAPAPTSSPTAEDTAEPTQEPAEARTIEDVWAKIGCETGDPTGTRGMLDLSEPQPPVVSTGTCTPYEDGDMAFFFELPDAAAVPAWLASGALEVGATDALYTDGAVVILATDARTAQEFAALFTPVG